MQYTAFVALTMVTYVSATKPYITNGNPAAPGQFPYQAALFINTGVVTLSFCGGSLISNEWVLTAAHCTVAAKSVRVFLGSNLLGAGTSYLVSGSNIRNHPGYKSATLSNDIALLRIPFTKYTTTIQSVNLPRIASSYANYAGQIGFASGWGSISDRKRGIVKDLRWARMPIISNKECARTFNNVKDSTLCVSTVGGISTCQGDSGGPLVLPGRNRLLVGITSFGARKGCARGFPAGFTRVSSYLQWIKEVTKIDL